MYVYIYIYAPLLCDIVHKYSLNTLYTHGVFNFIPHIQIFNI